MKFTILLAAVFAAVVMASSDAPALRTRDVISETGDVLKARCVECPCEGFDGPCQCVTDGCCC